MKLTKGFMKLTPSYLAVTKYSGCYSSGFEVDGYKEPLHELPEAELKKIFDYVLSKVAEKIKSEEISLYAICRLCSRGLEDTDTLDNVIAELIEISSLYSAVCDLIELEDKDRQIFLHDSKCSEDSCDQCGSHDETYYYRI